MSLAERLEQVRERIAAAAKRAGRSPDDVRLVAVTKGQPIDVLRHAYELGLTDVGENRVEEAMPKLRALAGIACRWHMIGHVQSRKAREVAQHFQMVHSVDSLRLAQRLGRAAGAAGRDLPVLLQFNVSGEASKYGWPAAEPNKWNELLDDVSQVCALQHLRVRGLMTLAPLGPDSEAARPTFQRLRRLRDFLAERVPDASWSDLSMGMSDDFEVAVEEGASLVRIGRALFG